MYDDDDDDDYRGNFNGLSIATIDLERLVGSVHCCCCCSDRRGADRY